MRAVSVLALASGLIAGCGSHQPAPIVYGTTPAPASTGRIYNSPADYARVNEATRGGIDLMPSAAPVISNPLIGSPESTARVMHADIEEAELPPAPIYLSAPAYGDPVSGGSVIVQPGDTVYAISRRTGTSPADIIRTNQLPAPYTLEVGQTIRIPSGGKAVAPSQAVRIGGSQRIVRPGETLSSISRSTGVPLMTLAAANGLQPPYQLEVGDRLSIPPAQQPPAATKKREARRNGGDLKDLTRQVSYTPPPKTGNRLFEWPIKGAIIGEYGARSSGKRNDGVNIAAPVGTPVRAAADGEVVYRGAELDDFGNLLLIRHADGFVTAYAHNDVILVDKGQPVRQGQVVAKVGRSGAADQPQLHFEIRQNLKPVDPLALLEN
ncbi:MAG: M23 family metallopeptidase [Parvularculaceae bacterium]|nr:M23 family metallopeptidase [Parvularculaceae bacterium]